MAQGQGQEDSSQEDDYSYMFSDAYHEQFEDESSTDSSDYYVPEINHKTGKIVPLKHLVIDREKRQPLKVIYPRPYNSENWKRPKTKIEWDISPKKPKKEKTQKVVYKYIRVYYPTDEGRINNTTWYVYHIS